jgi:hypothetical protein
MQIHQVNSVFYTSWDQAYLNAQKFGAKVITHDVIDNDFDSEVDIENGEIKINFENGDEFEVIVEIEEEPNFNFDEPFNDFHIESIDIALGDK